MIFKRTIYSSKNLKKLLDDNHNVIELFSNDGVNIEVCQNALVKIYEVYYDDKLVLTTKLFRSILQKLKQLNVGIK
tara:strand:+ start:94 stop:321 length:228 start_codon:yes stop_codon:yes gene_type:complete